MFSASAAIVRMLARDPAKTTSRQLCNKINEKNAEKKNEATAECNTQEGEKPVPCYLIE